MVQMRKCPRRQELSVFPPSPLSMTYMLAPSWTALCLGCLSLSLLACSLLTSHNPLLAHLLPDCPKVTQELPLTLNFFTIPASSEQFKTLGCGKGPATTNPSPLDPDLLWGLGHRDQVPAVRAPSPQRMLQPAKRHVIKKPCKQLRAEMHFLDRAGTQPARKNVVVPGGSIVISSFPIGAGSSRFRCRRSLCGGACQAAGEGGEIGQRGAARGHPVCRPPPPDGPASLAGSVARPAGAEMEAGNCL